MVENIERVVIDASFVLNYLMPDGVEKKEVKNVLKKYENNKLEMVAPTILKYEICNAIRSAVKSKRIEMGHAVKIWANFEKLEIIYLEPGFISALNLSVVLGISFYDASYVFLARIKGWQLKTLDDKLLDKIKA